MSVMGEAGEGESRKRGERNGGRGRAARALIEPDDGVEVQVIGGLVQHQQRWLHEQRPGRRGREVRTGRLPGGRAR